MNINMNRNQNENNNNNNKKSNVPRNEEIEDEYEQNDNNNNSGNKSSTLQEIYAQIETKNNSDNPVSKHLLNQLNKYTKSTKSHRQQTKNEGAISDKANGSLTTKNAKFFNALFQIILLETGLIIILCDDSILKPDHTKKGRVYCQICHHIIWYAGAGSITKHFKPISGAKKSTKEKSYHCDIYEMLKYVYCSYIYNINIKNTHIRIQYIALIYYRDILGIVNYLKI